MKYFSLILFIMILGCAKPKYTKLYKGKFEPDTLSFSPIDIAISRLYDTKPSVQKSNLIQKQPKISEELYDKVLDKILAKPEDTDKILSSINQLNKVFELETPKYEQSENLDETEFRIKLNISNLKKYYKNSKTIHPGTRLTSLTYEIKPSKNFIIKAINNFQSIIDTVELGSIEANTTQKITPEIAPQGRILKATGIAKIPIEVSETLKENLSLRQNRLRVGYSFDEKKININQTGALLNDIYENQILDITLKNEKNFVMVVTEFENLFDTIKINPINEIKVKKLNYNYVKCASQDSLVQSKVAESLVLDILADGVLRTITNNKYSSSVLEYDDKVKYSFFKIPIQTYTINIQEYCNKTYWIKYGDYNLAYNNPILGKATQIAIKGHSYTSKYFLNWLKNSIKIDKKIPTDKFHEFVILDNKGKQIPNENLDVDLFNLVEVK